MSSENKRGRGRPPVDSERVDTRLPRKMLNAIDRFARKEGDKPIRAEAVRRILHDWLIAHGYLKPEPEE